MKGVELYRQVRHSVRIEGLSRREAARRFGLDPRTVAKMLAFSVPPGYRRSRPPARPKLDPFVGIIDQILKDDKGRSAKQRHTSKRIRQRRRRHSAPVTLRPSTSSARCRSRSCTTTDRGGADPGRSRPLARPGNPWRRCRPHDCEGKSSRSATALAQPSGRVQLFSSRLRRRGRLGPFAKVL